MRYAATAASAYSGMSASSAFIFMDFYEVPDFGLTFKELSQGESVHPLKITQAIYYHEIVISATPSAGPPHTIGRMV